MLTTTNDMENLIPPEAIVTVTDYIVLIIIGMYSVFSFLLMRQIKLMNKSLATPLAPFYNFFGRLHFAVSLMLLLAAVINL